MPRQVHVLLASLVASAPLACSDDAQSPAQGESGHGSTGAPSSTDGDTAGDADDGSSGEPDGDNGIVMLDPAAQLVRISMGLRGTRPSKGELEAVVEDPTVLPDLVDDYLESAEFGETVREIHNEAWLVQTENAYPVLDPLTGEFGASIGTSLTNGPLRLAEYIVMNDRPYTELVTADYAVMDAITAAVWGVAFDPGGDALQTTSQQPGPPPAGVLSDGVLWIRYRSDAANYHRGRANLVSTAFLCTDFLERDIELDTSIDLADPDAVSEAVRTNPSCVSCHAALDGLASFFWGWRGVMNPGQITEYPINNWLANGVDQWQLTTERPPNYFGTDGDDLAALGQLIADDPRFSLCTAQRFYSFFHQVPLADVPLEAAAELQAAFIDSGFAAKALVRAIVLDDDYLVSHATDEVAAAALVGVKKARPSQLARLVGDLTGFAWQTNIDMPPFLQPPKYVGDIDLLRTTHYGFAVLAGGIDGLFVNQTSDTINATTSLVVRQLAHRAAAHVVASNLSESDLAARRLLGLIEADDTDEALVRAQLVELHARLYGELVDADSASVTDAWTLFSWSLTDGGPQHAWVVTIAAMLQDHRIVFF